MGPKELERKVKKVAADVEALEETVQRIRDRCFQVFEELENQGLIEDNPFHWDNVNP